VAGASAGLSLQVSGVLVNAMGFFAVGVGAALGAWMRWGLSAALNHVFVNLPLGTFASNMIGGYLIGVAVEVAVHHSVLTPELRLFTMTGFLGGLTTFSTFSAEAVGLLTRQQYGWGITLVLAHLLGSLAMTIFGIMTVRTLSG
jgi:CrcB protein